MYRTSDCCREYKSENRAFNRIKKGTTGIVSYLVYLFFVIVSLNAIWVFSEDWIFWDLLDVIQTKINQYII